MKKAMYTLALLLFSFTTSTFCQSPPNSVLYTVSTDGNDVLHRYDFDSQTWTVAGETGTENLKALEFDQISKTLYGVDEGKLGTIDVATGAFSNYGIVNSGEGIYGTLVLDDIQDITYDTNAGVLYAVHRISGNGPDTNDVLFQIDPATGIIKKNAMTDSSTSNRVDYAAILEVFDSNDSFVDLYDVSGIAFHPYASQLPYRSSLFVVHTQNGGTVISGIDESDGFVNKIVYDTSLSFLNDFCFDQSGQVYSIQNDFNSIEIFNLNESTSKTLTTIDPTGTYQNFQSLAVSFAVNDLALEMTLSPSQTLPITEEDLVTFDLTIYNQGEVTVDEIKLISYLSEDVYLSDESWTMVDHNARKVIQQRLAPDASFTTTLQVEVKEDIERAAIRNAVEIASAYNFAFTDTYGHPVVLSDIDSFYDEYNNEDNGMDDEINSAENLKNEDEDDHDIVTFSVGKSSCSCFSVAQNNGAENELYAYNEANDNWINIGKTGTTDLKALTYVDKTQTLFGIEQGEPGTIDITTGQFTGFGMVNSGEGSYGTIILNDIEALTYDTHLDVLYAVHRIPGNDPGTNDVLFQIDPATGLIIKNGMTNPATGNSADYVIIQEIFGGTYGGDAYDVSGIAFNPYSQNLFAVHNSGQSKSVLSSLNQSTGEINSIVYDMPLFLSDLAFNKKGEMYGVTGVNGDINEDSDLLADVNLSTVSIFTIGKIDPEGTSQNFQSLACQATVNDLALKITPYPSQDLIDEDGGSILYSLTIYNQGNIRIDEFTLSGYFSDDIANIPTWQKVDRKAYKTFKQVIEPGDSLKTYMSVLLLSDKKGTLRTAVEINSAYSYDITNEDGDMIPLQDIDSKYDDLDNETNIVDNEINGSGLNEDEDDHDIVDIKVNVLNCNCFSVAQNNGAENELYQYDAIENTWYKVGETGTTGIKALAYVQSTNKLYGIEQGKLGTINESTGQFNSFGVVNSGEGSYGKLTLDDIEGLTYNVHSGVLFAVHRIPGTGPETNDVLFQIDPATGLIIKNGMRDSSTGNSTDYVIIAEVFDSNYSVDLYDVSGITYNPYTNQLFAIQFHKDFGENTLSEINQKTGQIEAVIYDLPDDYISDIAISKNGGLLAVTGINETNRELSDVLIDINLTQGLANVLNSIDPTSTSHNFQSLACKVPVNDLALKMDINTELLPFIVADDPTYNQAVLDVFIYNQGDIVIDEFNLSVNMWDALAARQSDDWTITDNVATKNFQKRIEPGRHFCITVYLQVKEDFEGLLKIAAEIESAYNYDIVDSDGNLAALLDIDSQYDQVNNEINIIDDEINGGGALKNEDEDDHDITYVKVITDANTETTINAMPCYAVAHNNGDINTLSVYNPLDGLWRIAGIIGTKNIKSLAIDQANNKIYAADEGILGMLNSNTGAFSPVGTVNTGDGDHGKLILNNIYGLTYDADQGVLYAAHRLYGNDDSGNDVVFQIDPATGSIVPNAMKDASANAADYAVVPSYTESGVGFHDLRDVTDLSINPYTGKLYASVSNNNVANILIEINKQTAEVESPILSWDQNDELGAITFIAEDQLYATLYQPNGETQLILTDMQTQEHTSITLVDANNTVTDFLALDCSNSVCMDERNISESLNNWGRIASGLYRAGTSISSNGIIDRYKQNVTYKAGVEIGLETGFEVKKGNGFCAEIEDCK